MYARSPLDFRPIGEVYTLNCLRMISENDFIVAPCLMYVLLASDPVSC